MLSTRREFMRLAATLGVAEAVGSSLEALAQPTVIRVRQNVRAFSTDQAKVDAFRLAVRTMKDVSATRPNDPKGWNYWASIHGATSAPPRSLQNIYNQCQHGTDDFLSWHRAFLFFFESVLKQSARDAGSTTEFELPYWDWYSQPVMPAMFTRATDPAGQRNSLLHTRTNTDLSDDALDRSAFGFANMLPGGNTPPETTFSYVLEGDPHGLVHGLIGGDMGFVARSARDPIFWLHHANIDRLWTVWMTGGARVLPSANSAWARQRFAFDTQGAMSKEMGPLLDSKIALGYRYDDETAGTALVAASERSPIGAPIVAASFGRKPIVVETTAANIDFGAPPSAAAASMTLSATRAPVKLGNSPVAVDMRFATQSAAQLSRLASSQPLDVKSADLVLEDVELGAAGKDGGFGFKVVGTLADGDGAGRRVVLGSLNSFSLSVEAHRAGHSGGGGGRVTLKFPLANILSQLGATTPDILSKGLRVTFEPAHFDEVGGKEPDFVKMGAVKILGSRDAQK